MRHGTWRFNLYGCYVLARRLSCHVLPSPLETSAELEAQYRVSKMGVRCHIVFHGPLIPLAPLILHHFMQNSSKSFHVDNSDDIHWLQDTLSRFDVNGGAPFRRRRSPIKSLWLSLIGLDFLTHYSLQTPKSLPLDWHSSIILAVFTKIGSS